jgi:hypothetical protein
VSFATKKGENGRLSLSKQEDGVLRLGFGCELQEVQTVDQDHRHNAFTRRDAACYIMTYPRQLFAWLSWFRRLAVQGKI